MSEKRLEEFYREVCDDLDRTMNFWLKFSHDEEFGGFITCLGPTGEVYDDTKYVWFQGRQIWMYARMYNEDQKYRTPEVLQAAVKGAEFLTKYAKDPKTSKCYLTLTRDGKPIKVQRSIFSECFYILGMSELAIATKDDKYKNEAVFMMDKVVHWVREDSADVRLGLPELAGSKPCNSMAVPMMMLCLIDQMVTMETEMAGKYEDLQEWCIGETLAHVQREGTVILENVSTTGKELPGPAGRVMNPGHAIEAGWFLLQLAQRSKKEELKQTAIDKFIMNPFKYGWDEQYGGLFYFLDADGLSPVQLEWNMKLWWPHNEAMIAFLMAYQETQDTRMLDNFATVFDYSYSKFVDKETGEWVGYLNRDGTVCMNFKGGPWKGCFHVPRALLFCKKILGEMLKK